MALFVPDANVLIHALRTDSAEHVPCRRWLLNAVGLGDTLGLCELVEVALLRIPTLPKLQLVPMFSASRDDTARASFGNVPKSIFCYEVSQA